MKKKSVIISVTTVIVVYIKLYIKHMEEVGQISLNLILLFDIKPFQENILRS